MELPTGAYPGWRRKQPGSTSRPWRTIAESASIRILKNEFEHVAPTRLMAEGDPARVIAEYVQKLARGPDHDADAWLRAVPAISSGIGDRQAAARRVCPVWTSAHVPEAPAPLIFWATRFAREHGAR
jgi:hypothetical protein